MSPTFVRRFAWLCFLGLLLSVGPSFPLHAQPNPLIQKMIAQADVQSWLDTIEALVQNEDLDQPGHDFRSRYALRVREAVTFDGKPPPDDACDNAADFIAHRLESYGLQVTFDPFPLRQISLGGVLGEYTLRNVIATLPGRGPHADRIYLITAHYDSIASKTEGWEDHWRTLPAPGATDNASGVAEMLEIARILSQYPFDFTLQFVAFSGEELGLHGSRHFAEKIASQAETIAGVINVDQLGHDEDGLLDIHVVANQDSAWLAHAFTSVQKRYGIDVQVVPVVGSEFVYSDHAPFWEIGVNAVMVAEESSFEGPEWPEYTHSAEDTLDKLTPALGKRALQLLIATVAELAGPLDSSVPPLPDLVMVRLQGPDQIPLGQPATFDLDIMNVGENQVLAPLQVVLEDSEGNQEVVYAETAIPLRAGEVQSLQVTFSPPTWDRYQVIATLNPEVVLFESDFRNNTLKRPLRVVGPMLVTNAVLFPNPFVPSQEDGPLHVRYRLSEDARVRVEVYTVRGQPVYSAGFPLGDSGGRLGPNEIAFWEGRNEDGEPVAPGLYLCAIRASDSEGRESQRWLKLMVQ